MAWVFDHVIECHKLEIVFVLFQVGFKVGYDDRIVSEDIQKLMQNGVSSPIATPETSLEAIDLMSRASMVPSVRFHALIFAMMVAVPMVASSYDR